MNSLPQNTIKDKITESLDIFEELTQLIAARIAPLLAPLGPAYFVGRAIHHHLDAHWLVAGIMAAAVELVGIAATHTAVKAWTWNQGKRKSDPAAPFSATVALSIVYFLAAVALSVVLEVYPSFAPFAPAVFLILAAVAYVSMALSAKVTNWMTDRQVVKGLSTEAAKLTKAIKTLTADVDKLRSERDTIQGQIDKLRSERQALDNVTLSPVPADDCSNVTPKATQGSDTAATLKAMGDNARLSQVDSRRSELLKLWSEGLTDYDELAKHFDVTPRTIRRDAKALQLNGYGGLS